MLTGRQALFAASRVLTPAQFTQRLAGLDSESLQKGEIVRGRLGIPQDHLQAALTQGMSHLHRIKGWYLCPGETHWPTPMRRGVLRGSGKMTPSPRVAIIGARRADPKGLETAVRVATAAVHAGYVVVSGGALGIDAAAHQGALAAGGLCALVFGSGLNEVSPRRNRPIFNQVRANGVWLSPFPCEAPPTPWRFPERNRWIAALSERVVVVQAAMGSGALYTARIALKLGREVFVVPGNMDDPLHAGCHALLAEGAQVLATPGHCFPTLPRPVSQPSINQGPASAKAARLWRLTSGEAKSIGEFTAELGGEISDVSALAVQLEIAGWLIRHPSGGYTRGRPECL
mgnify:CR=1 FL=1